MADFEDANSPTWANVVEGQINLRDAVRGVIEYTSPEGKRYSLNRETAVLIVRPRGWHLVEKHVTVDGRPVSGSLFDFGLYLFHNAQALLERGTGPVLLPAQAREPPRGAALERRLRAGPEAAGAAARHDQGHRADRDDPGGLRDARDPLRAARPHRRAQLRPLGLHLQRHQEVPQPARVRAPRPGGGDDDHASHAVVLAPDDPDLPPARGPCDGRHGGADPDQGRPAGQRGRAPQGARGQGARGVRRPRRHLGRPPRARPDRAGGVQRPDARAEPARPAPRGRERHRRRPADRPDGRRSPSRGCGPTSTSGSGTSRAGCAAAAASRSST